MRVMFSELLDSGCNVPSPHKFFSTRKKKATKMQAFLTFYNKAKTILDLSNLFNKFINLNNTNKKNIIIIIIINKLVKKWL
jgi:hypothetical protein